MNHLSPAFVTAWSWVNALGRAHSEAPGLTLDTSFSREGLRSHEEDLKIPGYSGRFLDELPPLPAEHRHRDSRTARLLLAALRPLEEKIRSLKSRLGSERIAILLGSSTGGIDATELALRFLRRTGHLPPDYSFRDVHPYDALLQLLSSLLGIDGPAWVVSTACSSSGKAMASAQRLLHTRVVDAVLVGGSDALCEMTIRGFSGLGILSEQPCRPFELGRSGISIGEGAGLLLLESNDQLSLVHKQPEAPLQMLGAGESSDAYHATAPHPEGRGAELAMRNCLTISGISPQEVDYLNAHGTGTEKNDAMEALAISKVLGEGVAFSSTKHKLGHQLGTAGATEAIVCLQALSEGRISNALIPNLGAPSARDPHLAAQPLRSIADTRLKVALSNSFAFGGSNVTIALSRSRGRVTTRGSEKPCFVEGVAVWSPEFPTLKAFQTNQRSADATKPPAEILSTRARGRASMLTRAFAEIYGQLQPSEASTAELGIPSVYASCFGEMETTLQLLDQLENEPRLSPLRFQASVHNTASGLISLETKNRAFTTALAAGIQTFSTALIEAQAWLSCHGGEILVLVAEEELPPRLEPELRYPPLGVGLRLSATRTGASKAELSFVHRTASTDLGTTREQAARLLPYAAAPPVWGLSLVDALESGYQGEVVVGPQFATRIGPL